MDFKKTVKKRLIDLEKTDDWLIEQVKEKTGLFFDSSYLSKIFRGVRPAPKIRAAICEILSIQDDAG